MINVLINAYAVAPNRGSEPGMGWNWVINIAKYCNVYVITEGEWKDEIELELEQLPQKDNIHFYYCPVSDKIRKMCWNQGDWRFYYFYRQWQKKALLLAKSIIATSRIDLIHQLNMVGFREPGLLWKIKGIPFIWGPVGGMDNIPIEYIEELNVISKFKILIKNWINCYQRSYQVNVKKATGRASFLLAATKQTFDFLSLKKANKVALLNETGCHDGIPIAPMHEQDVFRLVWIGKFDFRKQLGLALNTIALIKDLPGIRFDVVGTGSISEIEKYQTLAISLGISDIVTWHGQIPHYEINQILSTSDLLFFTSIHETTSSVVPEAIQNSLPVLCFNICGFGPLVKDRVGHAIELSTPQDSIARFADEIRFFYSNRNILEKYSNACNKYKYELSWDNKAQRLMEYYKSVLFAN